METFSAPGYWPFVRGIRRSPVNSPHNGQWRGVFFYLRLNKRLSKQPRRRWFETPSRSLWRHCVMVKIKADGKILADMICCRIWSWSPMPCAIIGFDHGLPCRVKNMAIGPQCEKHGPRDSVDKNWGRRPRFLSLLRPEGHVFHTAWETMIKSYYSTLTDWFFSCFIHINVNFSALKWAFFGSLHGC